MKEKIIPFVKFHERCKAPHAGSSTCPGCDPDYWIKDESEKEVKEIKKVHSEVYYTNKDGSNIHSDTCPPDCDFNKIDDKYRKYLHDLLDEWLNNSNGTGIFYVKQEGYTDFDF